MHVDSTEFVVAEGKYSLSVSQKVLNFCCDNCGFFFGGGGGVREGVRFLSVSLFLRYIIVQCFHHTNSSSNIGGNTAVTAEQ